MSEIINNREYRQKILKELIMELHQGKSVEEVKTRFEKLIEGVSATEISEMEQALIAEGMAVEEIQNLCEVHAAVFKGSIEEIHKTTKGMDVPGHPLHTFLQENKEVAKLIKEKILPAVETFQNHADGQSIKNLADAFQTLWEIDKHYARKENLVFPFMEKYGITAPPKVMWGVDDEIRAQIKEVSRLLAQDGSEQKSVNEKEVAEKAIAACTRVAEMIFKEENILFPMVLDALSEDEWTSILESSNEIGYCLYEPMNLWKPVQINVEEKEKEHGKAPSNDGYIKFDAGLMLPEEINAILNTLPFDITFVDKDGAVKYFSQGKERIFARTKTIIGRQVSNCHPPASVHIVEQIVKDLTAGRKDHEDFWIKLGEKFVFIRYFAVRNQRGEYLGTIEVSQDIKPIQEITGEKRLAD